MARIPTLIPKTWVALARDTWKLIFEHGGTLDTVWRLFVLVVVGAGLAVAAMLSSVSIVFSVVVLTVAFTISDRVVIGTITDVLERRFYVLEVDVLG